MCMDTSVAPLVLDGRMLSGYKWLASCVLSQGQLVAIGSKQEIHEKLNVLEVEYLKKQVSEPVASTIDPEPMPVKKRQARSKVQ